ncbi:helix-turn-helix domain-containing protein [Streptomyces sp. 8L]|uniref:helix-turn-helix domain-containing protein n=1 Tax=Streptomyces sp. 8L TaxID=2877242 RepID=UPI001CD7BA5C|nr:helix-turn-helix transcriptional regulator [Streptomyces sp. 8L]MCA1223430.1 helix-turn-helix transcriptional regulator [Streptomyces sp. 8L]
MTHQNHRDRDRDNDFDPYSSPRAFYGAELRLAREKSGLSQDRLGDRVFCSGTYIGQFEAATRRPQPDVSRLLDGVFGTGDRFQRLCRFANQSKHAEYFAKAAELEQDARTISEYAPMLLPGLLQTRAYAHALISATLPFDAEDVIDGFVEARLERQAILSKPTAPVLWAILHEAALRVPVGGAAVMADQLNHIVQMARASRRLIVQVLPFEAGAAAFLDSSAVVMTFQDAPSVTYTESAYTGQLIDDPATVAQFERAYDLIRAASLPPESSLDLIASVAKDYAGR